MGQELGQVHLAAGLLRFGGRNHLIHLLLGGHTAQKSQNCAHFTDIYELVAMVIKHTEGIGNALLQVIIYLK